MNPDHLIELKSNEVVRKRLAKWMTKFCLRDTKLEEFHDRLTDEEMKELMIDSANHCYAFLSILFATHGGGKLIDMLEQDDPVPQWNEPEMPAELRAATKVLRRILEHLKQGRN
jgi:hypothetical protein